MSGCHPKLVSMQSVVQFSCSFRPSQEEDSGAEPLGRPRFPNVHPERNVAFLTPDRAPVSARFPRETRSETKRQGLCQDVKVQRIP